MIKYTPLVKCKLVFAFLYGICKIVPSVCAAETVGVVFEGEAFKDPFRWDIGEAGAEKETPEESEEPEEEVPMPAGFYRLEGLVWNTQMPQAIVNGEVVGVGDTISGGVVREIGKQGVVILEGKREVTLLFEKKSPGDPGAAFPMMPRGEGFGGAPE